VNGGVERLRGCLRVALDDLEESLSERPALATTREAIAARELLRSTLRSSSQPADRMSDDRDGHTFIDRRMRILAPLRHRDFRMLWTGMTASLLGDGVFYVALAWQAYELSNTPSALSTIGVAMTVPHVVFLLAGGVVSDRFDRRKVMIAADLMRAVAVGAMGALALSGRLELWHMFVLSGLFGAGRRSSVRRSMRSSPGSSRMPS
jgi:hypothetical protein